MGRMRAPIAGRTLFGRQAESEVLSEALADVRAGIARAVVVSGEAGMGKTRLLAEFRQSLGPDTLVLSAACVDLGPFGVPFGPIREILRQLAAVVDIEQLVIAAGTGRPALVALLPELVSGDERSDEPAHETVVSLLRVFSHDRPIVLVLDDAQWADAATLSVLRYLLKTLTTERVLVVVAYRTEDTGRTHPLRQALAELDQARAVSRMELRGLDDPAILSLLTELRGSEPDRENFDRIARRSQGVPFFIEELVGLGSESIPDSLRDVLLARYNRVDPDVQVLLRTLAVGGVRVSHDVLREVLGGIEIDAAARAAIEVTLLLPADDGYAFRHALVREAVLQELLPGERRRLHERYAAVLSAAGAAASETSYHWLAAGDLAQALVSSVEAFDQAVSGRAYASAVQLGERVVELWERVPDAEERAGRDRGTLIDQLAAAAVDSGDRRRGMAWIDEAISAVDPLDRRTLVGFLRTKANLMCEEGVPGAEDVFVTALDVLGDDDDLVLRARVQLNLSGRYHLTGRVDESRAMLALAHDTAVRSGDDEVISSALLRLGWEAMEDGDIERGKGLLEESHAHAGDGEALLLHGTNATDNYVQIGDYRAALAVADPAILRARELGLERSWGGILSNSVDALLALGLWEEADARGERVLAVGASGCSIAMQHQRRIVMANWRDDTPGAAAIAQDHGDLLDRFSAHGDLQDVLPYALALGELAFFEGDLDKAWMHASAAWSPTHEGATSYDLPLLALAARIVGELRRAGRPIPDGAIASIDAVFAHSTAWPIVPRWHALVDAELSGADGAGAEIAAWGAAAETLMDESMPAHLGAYAWWRRGQAELAVGDRVAAARSLRTAEERANRIGASWVSRRARELLQTAALGERPRGHQDRLTARERQVLDLVAEGLTNREISERLSISGKTTSTHVSAILRKLGATTRTQAAVMAERVVAENTL